MKKPVLVASSCLLLEKVRMAIEVLTGKRTCFVCFDFNTNRGRIRIGDDEIQFGLCLSNSGDLTDIRLNERDFYFAKFSEDSKEVRVIGEFDQTHTRKTAAGTFEMWWVGSSATDRREEPVDLEGAKYCAKVRGMSLKELLNSGK